MEPRPALSTGSRSSSSTIPRSCMATCCCCFELTETKKVKGPGELSRPLEFWLRRQGLGGVCQREKRNIFQIVACVLFDDGNLKVCREGHSVCAVWVGLGGVCI